MLPIKIMFLKYFYDQILKIVNSHYILSKNAD